MQNNTIPRTAYSVNEAAEALGLSRQTVYSLIHTPSFPSVKVGGRTLIPVAALETWLNTQMMSQKDLGERV